MRTVGGWLTENLSRVNCGPRIDVREVWWERIDAVSKLDVVRNAGSIVVRRKKLAIYKQVQCLL